MIQKPDQGPMPSLNALRAFEAMARSGSATRAAQELCVTHGAVSRQVKALEAALGVRLFDGPRHRLTLTRVGRDLAPELTAAFDRMARAVGRTRRDGDELHIAVNASLSVKWLIPRLSEFAHLRPDIQVRLSNLEPQAVSQRGADLILRFLAPGQIEQMNAVSLSPVLIGPVVAPQLLAADPSLERTSRLVVETHPQGWSEWARLSGRPAPSTPERPVAHLHFALDAALAGWGAAVLPWTLVCDDVAAGKLAAPFGFVPDGGCLALIRGEGPPRRPSAIFQLWVQEQITREAAPPPPVVSQTSEY